MDHVKEEQNNIYYITVRLKERATWNNEDTDSCLILLFGIFHAPWLVGEQLLRTLWKVVHGLRIQQVCLGECFQYSSLLVFES